MEFAAVSSTVLYVAGTSRSLISEAVRGEGHISAIGTDIASSGGKYDRGTRARDTVARRSSRK
ncbi:MAG: hypothetical protein U1D30_05570 [Planctomycetota bacterium]